MKNYICINGNKVELTEQQILELGFSTNTALELFIKVLRSGYVQEHYKIHDVLTVGEYELEIIGFNHDRAVGNEDAPTVTVMAKRLLPRHRMYSGSCKKGWIDSELRQWLNNDVLSSLPSEITKYICNVKKSTHNYNGEVYETTDKLFIPSESELFGSAIYSGYEDGKRYEAFATSKYRQRIGDNDEPDWYWSRNQFGGDSTSVCTVGNTGDATGNSASYTSFRAPLCFTFA